MGRSRVGIRLLSAIKWVCGDVEDDAFNMPRSDLSKPSPKLKWAKICKELGYVLRMDDLDEEIMVDISIVNSRILAMHRIDSRTFAKASGQDEAAWIAGPN